MNKESAKLTIVRRFNSLLSAVETFESEGKIDLSYNRDLAIRDAKYTDHRSKPVVLELETGLHLIVTSQDGLKCMTKYSPFCSVMHDGDLAILFPVNESGAVCGILEAVELNRVCELANNPENRKLIAKSGGVAGC